MSELKVGDVVSYRGNKGVIRQVLDDGKEKYYRIDVTETKIRYLYKDELDSLTDQTTLNENQQIVLDWLKKHSNHPFDAVQIINTKQAQPEVNRVIYKLSKIEQSQILQAFASWVLEQEEDNNVNGRIQIHDKGLRG